MTLKQVPYKWGLLIMHAFIFQVFNATDKFEIDQGYPFDIRPQREFYWIKKWR